MTKRRAALLAVLTSASALAAIEGFPFSVAVGEKGLITLPTVNVMTVCDDPSLVSIGESADGGSLELTGLKPGKTQCSFGAVPGRGFRAIYDVVVTGRVADAGADAGLDGGADGGADAGTPDAGRRFGR